MKISLIGSGNVATSFAKLITKADHKIVQVFSRNLDNAKLLAEEYGATYSNYNENAHAEADLFIIATADHSFTDLLPQFKIQNRLIVHTAGSVSIDILQEVSQNYGVIYPLQTLHKHIKELPEIPLLIDANNEKNMNIIQQFAKSVSTNVTIVHDQERFTLHTAAVIVNNFTNHLYTIAENYCKAEQANFNLLKPLILETANRIMLYSPKDVQTGPAIRKDIKTLDKHLRLLNKYPKLRTTYMRLTDGIMNP